MVMTLRRTSKRTRLGIDMGGGGLRIVRLERGGGGFVIAAAAQVEAPPSSDDTAAQYRTRAQFLRGLVSGLSRKGESCMVGLSPPDIEFFSLDLPAAAIRTGGPELANVVRWEVERLMTTKPDHLETRHWTLPATSAPAPSVIAVGTGREAATEAAAICRLAGVHCQGVDTSATALSRFGCLLRNWPSDVIWGLLDLGQRHVRLVLCLRDVPVLIRTVGTGGAELTKRIAESLQISAKAAELHKREHGIATSHPIGRRQSDEADGSELGGLIASAVRPDLNSLVSEIKRSYSYILSCYPGKQAGDLVLVGGGADLRNLPDFLTNGLGISVQTASAYAGNNASRMEKPDPSLPPLERLALAVGLAVPAEVEND